MIPSCDLDITIIVQFVCVHAGIATLKWKPEPENTGRSKEEEAGRVLHFA